MRQAGRFHLIKTQALTVAGVIEDLPANETLQFDFVLPWSYNEEQNQWLRTAGWGSNNCYTLVELQDKSAFATVDAQLRKTLKANEPASNAVAFLHPMAKWHLYSKFDNGVVVGGQIEQVRMFALMAIAILLIACINFMNLSTARVHKRAKEVGIRKTIGGSRRALAWQFFIESLFFSALASLLAMLLLLLGFPSLNRAAADGPSNTVQPMDYSGSGLSACFYSLVLAPAAIRPSIFRL